MGGSAGGFDIASIIWHIRGYWLRRVGARLQLRACSQ